MEGCGLGVEDSWMAVFMTAHIDPRRYSTQTTLVNHRMTPHKITTRGPLSLPVRKALKGPSEAKIELT